MTGLGDSSEKNKREDQRSAKVTDADPVSATVCVTLSHTPGQIGISMADSAIQKVKTNQLR